MYNTKKIIRNAFRISKVRGESAIRVRVPGGDLNVGYLETIKELAERFGNGLIHLTTRQGFEIPGVKLSQLDEIKKYMGQMISEIEKESGFILEKPEKGYPAAGTRNVCACVGDNLCQFANCNAPLLARKIEKIIYPPTKIFGGGVYPNHYHLKIAVTACPNDCIKAHIQDIGIIAGVVPEYDSSSCIACEACLDNCRLYITNSLRMENYRIIRDEDYCLQCGECILKCPMGALWRGKTLYRIIIGGRTGKRNPRMAGTFIKDASEEVALAVCKNVYAFIDHYIDRTLPKEQIGYIIDRVGVAAFAQEVTRDITLNPEAKIMPRLDNPGYLYPVTPKKI